MAANAHVRVLRLLYSIKGIIIYVREFAASM